MGLLGLEQGGGELTTDAGKVEWRSRRGMLEVEILLAPFARERYHKLVPADQEAFTRLLERDDWTIHDWLRGASQPADEALNRIVSLIRKVRGGDGAAANPL